MSVLFLVIVALLGGVDGGIVDLKEAQQDNQKSFLNRDRSGGAAAGGKARI